MGVLRPILRPVLRPILRAPLDEGDAIRLVAPGALAPDVIFSRASAGTYLGPDDTTYQAAAQDAPRFQGSARRLLIEGARTNVATNPSGAGAAPGANQPPAGWQSVQTTGGLTRTWNGSGNDEFGAYHEFRLAGVTTNALPTRTYFIAPQSVVAAAGQLWASSVIARAVPGGTTGGATFGAYVQPRTGATAASGSATSAAVPLGTAPAPARVTATVPTGGDNVTAEIQVNLASGVTCDFLVRVYYGGLEQAAFSSSPIFPPAGTVAASTRAGDAVTFALPAALASQGTLVGTFKLDDAGAPSIARTFATLHDGTNNNRLLIRQDVSGPVRIYRIINGSSTQASLGSPLVAGQIGRFAFAWDAAGMAGMITGAANVVALSGLPAITALSIGGGLGAGAELFGEVGPFDLYPTRLANAQLRTLTA